MEFEKKLERHVEWTIAVSSFDDPNEVVDVLYTEDGVKLLSIVPALEELGLNTCVSCAVWFEEVKESEDK